MNVGARAHSKYESGQPDADEDVVAENASEEVAFAVNLTCVEFVEQSHRDERREHHRVVNVPLRNIFVVVGVVKVEQNVPFIQTVTVAVCRFRAN